MDPEECIECNYCPDCAEGLTYKCPHCNPNSIFPNFDSLRVHLQSQHNILDIQSSDIHKYINQEWRTK